MQKKTIRGKRLTLIQKINSKYRSLKISAQHTVVTDELFRQTTHRTS